MTCAYVMGQAAGKRLELARQGETPKMFIGMEEQ
jgi:hypothetical protein